MVSQQGDTFRVFGNTGQNGIDDALRTGASINIVSQIDDNDVTLGSAFAVVTDHLMDTAK